MVLSVYILFAGLNVTTPVKNSSPGPQPRCATWPFAAIAAVESYNALFNKGPLVQLSEQQLMDCTPFYQTCSEGPLPVLLSVDFVFA